MTRLDGADEFLQDAQVCLNHGRFRSAASRDYYAVFHAAIALFEHYGLRPANFIGRNGWPATRWEHGLITKYFHLEFVVRRGFFDWPTGVAVRRLYRTRIEADYKLTMPLSEALARDSLEDAKRVVEAIRRRLV